MQAVCDEAQIETLDTRGSGELSSWQEYCQPTHHNRKEGTPCTAPWEEDAQKLRAWTSPDLALGSLHFSGSAFNPFAMIKL